MLFECDRFAGAEATAVKKSLLLRQFCWSRGQSCQEKLVIETVLPERKLKLSRKARYCDRFKGTEAKVVKKSMLL